MTEIINYKRLHLNICWFIKIGLRKWNFFGVKEFFHQFSKMTVNMNFRIITKNHAVDPEIGFLIKSMSKPKRRATAIPQAWELSVCQKNLNIQFIFKVHIFWKVKISQKSDLTIFLNSINKLLKHYVSNLYTQLFA